MRFIYDQQGARRLDKGIVQRHWLLSAGTYHYLRIPLPADLDPAQRKGALQLQVQAYSPYDHTGFQAVWSETGAQVWFWNQAAISGAQVGRLSYLVLPQTLMQQPLDSGLRLVRALAGQNAAPQGVEGQYWFGQQLRASHYWPEPPSAEQWRAFQRDAAVPVEQQQPGPPEPQSLPLLDKPHASLLRQGRIPELRQHLPAIQVGLAALLLLIAATRVIDLYRYHQAGEQLRAQVEQQRSEIQGYLASRNRALDAAQELGQLQQLLKPQAFLALFEEILEHFPRDMTLSEWRLQGQEMKLVFEGKPLLNTASIIQQLMLLPRVETAIAEETSAKRFQFTVILVK
ncbi:MAG: hypothetical protein OQL08_02270 [Gammaproteobacteria bacterium]|nr:hypothetical protein [Gammaproteobacteria bacterium]